MYTCDKALLKQRGDNSRVLEAVVNTVKVRSILDENSIAILVLSHVDVDHQMSLDLTTVTDLIYGLRDDITVDEWLQVLGDTALPTVDTVPTRTAAVAKCNDLFIAGYHATKVHPGASVDSDFPDEELTDILVTKTDVDYQLFYDHCLVTVNGLLHLTDASTAGVTIIDGGRTVNYSNKHEISIISFRDIGKVACYPIKSENVYKRGGTALKNGFNINLPGVDLNNKVIMVSLGGYLHFANHCYKMIGDNTINIEWYKLLFEERYFNSDSLIDLDAFNKTLVRNPNHGDTLDMFQAMSDESIMAYLTLSQTFIITLDASNFYFERHPLERTGLFGRYYTYERPDFPLQLESGLLPAYVAVPETEAYVIAIPDNYVRRYVSETKKPSDDGYFSGALYSSHPTREGDGYLLELGTEFLTTPTTTTATAP
jgi:hypothetical protein